MIDRRIGSLVLSLVLLQAIAWLPARAQWRPDGAPICAAASNQLTPAAIAAGGDALLVWYDYRSGGADIYAQRVSPSGVVDLDWPPDGLPVCMSNGGQYSPVLVSDGAGGAIVAWYDLRGSSADVYAQRVMVSGLLDPAWTATGTALSTASGDQIYPSIASDGAGGAIVAWRDYRGGPDTDVYAQRVLASGSPHPDWPGNGRALCTADGNQSAPAIASDGAGGAIVVWSDLRLDGNSDIYAQRVLASGSMDSAWPSDGLAVNLAAGNQSGPAVLSDGAGGAIVAWFDYRNGNDADIYAQRVLASGVVDPGWPAGGRELCAATGEQYSPVLVGDGVGGAIVAWYDYRAGEEADIYAHHLLASGAADPAWPADGRALCAAVGEQVSPSVVADGVGGAVVAWFDYRLDPASDIYAQHVLSSGEVDPSWPENGHALCAAPGSQFSPAIVSDGAGGVIAAWTDFRSGVYSDIYAQRVYAGGSVAEVSPERTSASTLLLVTPNPGRGQATLRVELSFAQRMRIEVLDVLGRRVRTVLPDQELSGGTHSFFWDGVSEAGMQQPSGVYWARVRAARESSTRRFVFLR